MCEPNMWNMVMALCFTALCGISIGTIFTCWMVNRLEDTSKKGRRHAHYR